MDNRIDEIFQDSFDCDMFFDVMLESGLINAHDIEDGRGPNVEQMIEYFNTLSPSTQDIAKQWGLCDTVFRDHAIEEFGNRVDHEGNFWKEVTWHSIFIQQPVYTKNRPY